MLSKIHVKIPERIHVRIPRGIPEIISGLILPEGILKRIPRLSLDKSEEESLVFREKNSEETLGGNQKEFVMGSQQ